MILHELVRHLTFAGGEKVTVRSGLYSTAIAAKQASDLERNAIKCLSSDVTSKGDSILNDVLGVLGVIGISMEVRLVSVRLVDTPDKTVVSS